MAVSRYLPLGGFGSKYTARLRYVESVSLNPSVTTPAYQVYRANSVYDPNFTGLGHQPSNYDRLTAIFDRYTVIGSKLKVYPVWTGNSNLVPGTLAVKLSEGGVDLATAHAAGGINNVLEQPRLTRSLRNLGNAQNFNSRLPLVSTFSATKFFGTKNIVGVPPYSADWNANPNEDAFYEIAYMSPDGLGNPDSMTFRIEIDYIVIFTEPKITDNS